MTTYELQEVGGPATNHLTVQLLRWPVERDLREDFRSRGVPRILVVEAGLEAPVCHDIYEDWVRAPVPSQDLKARADALMHRYRHNHSPHLDSSGVLHFGAQSVTLSPAQSELLTLLVARYGQVVPREELRFRLGEQECATTRNALDLHMMRIRLRISPLGLAIRTVWGRGYVLDTSLEETV
ncbi:helix-turn-helix domain-containing protein [Streptomyces sp. A7024]|uniref:Helix-turn-helix domain-containing protein n=1 Tax=Streptomyces coryli TaxID=1128680 RepID=A0A6G4TWH8_9ACTN|nr:helix-turn-helix domain-containing protein [Streptomyces coryli]NGN63397.1 helix-turn-helix domain-containing protein [Streptomyces coryli]